jgi:hypothetical protein
MVIHYYDVGPELRLPTVCRSSTAITQDPALCSGYAYLAQSPFYTMLKLTIMIFQSRDPAITKLNSRPAPRAQSSHPLLQHGLPRITYGHE